MATLSDDLWLVTIVAYLVAMLAYAAEYAFVNRPTRAGSASLRQIFSMRQAPELAGVSVGAAGAPPPDPGLPTGPPAEDESPTGWRALGRFSWVALGLLVVAALAHLATTVTRGLAAERLPFANMYEYALSATLIAVVAWFVILFRHPGIRHLSLYLALVNVLLIGAAGVIAYTPVEPLMPALDSHWFAIHIAAAAFASAAFLIGFVTTLMYLLRRGYENGRRGFPFTLAARIPTAATVERLSFGMHAFGFPIWTFAVAAGAIWAEASWGRYWGWDPKETWAFITWVIYAAYLHGRATPSVKRTVVAGLAILGFLTLMMNLFGVNLGFESLHSYA
ncbi:c-type cytochrome biogenesis protein CcsB [Natronosporangium hydrolyticum]|uniref:C-type cytochrome biogenesis protein CcsB n=1 Tax=Natronosporangium hydrolyticum TaxID=2811111 RepID=A0A895YAX6_9ACTN|nr:c-type cytochrome biogenesis protein CcsB [Natronosporangium hydrolyticum]QSB14897.1 c-type cytochrome biogenesis protein CcsB [Natronosporangium hydrolyticum]